MRKTIIGALLIGVIALTPGSTVSAKLPAHARSPEISGNKAVDVSSNKAVEAYEAGTVPSILEVVYRRKKRVIHGFVSSGPAEAVRVGDQEACLYDRKVTLFRSRKVGARWKDVKYTTDRTDDEGYFGWQWRKGRRPPSGWWTVKVAKTSFSSEYGGLVVCGAGHIAERIKT